MKMTITWRNVAKMKVINKVQQNEKNTLWSCFSSSMHKEKSKENGGHKPNIIHHHVIMVTGNAKARRNRANLAPIVQPLSLTKGKKEEDKWMVNFCGHLIKGKKKETHILQLTIWSTHTCPTCGFHFHHVDLPCCLSCAMSQKTLTKKKRLDSRTKLLVYLYICGLNWSFS